MRDRQGNTTVYGLIFLGIICGALYLLQLTSEGCNKAKRSYSENRQAAAAEQRRQQDALLSPAERARLNAERERQFQQFQRQQSQSAKASAEFERAVEVINAHGYDVKPAE